MDGAQGQFLSDFLSGNHQAPEQGAPENPQENPRKRRAEKPNARETEATDVPDEPPEKRARIETVASDPPSEPALSPIGRVRQAIYPADGPTVKDTWIEGITKALRSNLSEEQIASLPTPEELWGLQYDPAVNATRPNEFETSLRLLLALKRPLQRYQPGQGEKQKGDWQDSDGAVYDDCSPGANRKSKTSYRAYLRNANAWDNIASPCEEKDLESLPEAALDSISKHKTCKEMKDKEYWFCKASRSYWVIGVVNDGTKLQPRHVELQIVEENMYNKGQRGYKKQLTEHFLKTGANDDNAKAAYVVIDLVDRELEPEMVESVLQAAREARQEGAKQREDRKPVHLILLTEQGARVFAPGDEIGL